MITQDMKPTSPKAVPTPKQRSRGINGSTSPRSAGAAMVALHHFTSNTFIDTTKGTFTVNETPLEPQESANGVFYPITKETITKYNTIINDFLMQDV